MLKFEESRERRKKKLKENGKREGSEEGDEWKEKKGENGKELKWGSVLGSGKKICKKKRRWPVDDLLAAVPPQS